MKIFYTIVIVDDANRKTMEVPLVRFVAELVCGRDGLSCGRVGLCLKMDVTRLKLHGLFHMTMIATLEHIAIDKPLA